MALQTYFAVSARGIESVTAAELPRLGAADVRSVAGGVHFAGDAALLYRASLWLRTATRILRPLREFAAATPEMLYSQTRRVRWEDLLDQHRTLAVHATIEGAGRTDSRRLAKSYGASRESSPARSSKTPRAGITHSMYAALKIKDAIVDRLRREQGARPNVDKDNPDIRVHAHFADGRCTLSLDATGKSLHERGYRSEETAAPIKESLAAAVIDLSGWDGRSPLYDPLCGSGTLVIEAALKALRIAPGLARQEFAFHRWPDFDRVLWHETITAARNERLPQSVAPLIWGSDSDANAIRIATENAHRAGVGDCVRFFVHRAEDPVPEVAGPGYIVTNPPYGERLGKDTDIAALYERLGHTWQQHYAGWTICVLAGNLGLARHFGLTAAEKFKLWNGPLDCRLLRFQIPSSNTNPKR